MTLIWSHRTILLWSWSSRRDLKQAALPADRSVTERST